MKTNYIINAFGWIGLIITVLIVGLNKGCSTSATGPNNYVTENHITNVYDSAVRIIPVPVIQPADSVLVPVPADVDTALILRNYFTKYYYEQVIEDSCLRATIKDTLLNNSIFSRQFSYAWKKPVSIINTVKVDQKNKWFAGASIQGNLTGVDFVPGLQFQRKRTVYQASYGVLSQRVGIGVFYQLNFKHNGTDTSNISR